MVREPKTHALTIRFSESDWEKLAKLAEREDVSIATIVRRAVRAYSSRRKP